MISNELLILKEATGGRSLVQIGKDTKRDSAIKEGDQVEVEITNDGLARSITKLNGVR